MFTPSDYEILLTGLSSALDDGLLLLILLPLKNKDWCRKYRCTVQLKKTLTETQNVSLSQQSPIAPGDSKAAGGPEMRQNSLELSRACARFN